ncbi:hypothetical protein ABEB36_011783 [Hypothenemus hampei]|uniref:PH domain-containing protein n=1 Tax=Hypothenemus hampei TaxID=57062 RepID=A0ABD1EDB8_HYPHA
MSQCKKFVPNIFHKSKCSNCFRQKEEHTAEALECNRASRSIARSGYLFVAPDWDFSVPLNRTKRWQRRWFVLYDDGELNYSVDEHPDTIPQGSVDMSKVLEVTGAEQVTGHPHSLALTSPDRVTFVKAASREDARWWAELLAVFPRRHKRNATFPGGRASPSLPQLGRSASPQPPRPRHLSVNGPSPRTNFETPPLKEEREPSTYSEPSTDSSGLIRKDYMVSSGSPPTRDKLRCDDKAKARRDWRNERLRDIATALTDRSPESSLALPAEGLLHLKKGWLWLKTMENEWVRRWIVLCGPTLNVYEDQDEHGVPEVSVELATVTAYMEIPTDSKYGFEIQWAGPTLTLSAVTQGIRSNWMQALKKAAPIPDTPPVSKSTLLSSDEEYRTASEGGRRESGDWSELPPSPPFNQRLALRVKDRARQRPRLPRCQSRQSTLDSTSTDELDSAKDLEIVSESHAHVIEDLQTQLARSVQEVSNLEEEIARLKKLHGETTAREKKTKDLLASLEKESNQRNAQLELKFLKEQKALQRRLLESEEASRSFEEKYEYLLRELQLKQQLLMSLRMELENSNEKLQKSREENERLSKKLQEFNRSRPQSARIQSLNDLTNIDLDLDIDELGTDELKEYCLDLKCRFEKAVIEIRGLKRALKSSEDNCDSLEIANSALKQTIELIKQDHQTEINLLVTRLDHLTSKLHSTEKQLKTKAKDKRRSLSLKGRESFSITKEVEDKVTELEAKIIALEKGRVKRRFRSNERSTPTRRKSLDSAVSLEPMKLLMRLTSLENNVINTSMESLSEETPMDHALIAARNKVMECLMAVDALKGCVRSVGVDKLTFIENTLTELGEILSPIKGDEANVIKTSAETVVKQLQDVLVAKLTALAEKRRTLRESGKLDGMARLELLAEKIAFENVLVHRIHEAFSATISGEAVCQRLLDKETKETAHLIIGLQNKLNGSGQKYQTPKPRTSAEFLARTLAKSLILSNRHGLRCLKNFVNTQGPSLRILQEERDKLEVLMEIYKTTKLPQLNCDTPDSLNEVVLRHADSELVQSELEHVLSKIAQVYRNNFHEDDRCFFTFYAAERAALEIWADRVNERLRAELQKAALVFNSTQAKQNFRRRVESERSVRANLQEFADIIVHKALIDARIDVLNGESVTFEWNGNEETELEAEPGLEAEFACMLEKFNREAQRPELEQVICYLEEFELKIHELESLVTSSRDNRPTMTVFDWSDVCLKCKLLRSSLENIKNSLDMFNRNPIDQRPVYLGTEYLTQVESLRAAYRGALVACKERHQEADIHHLQQLCERVFTSMEQWHRRTIQELRESHAQEVELLKQEKEQALAEETQATLAALDAMRKAHVAEVQREVARFKQEFARQQRDEVFDLSERLSVKSLEAAALEEQLGSATRQLAHAQQHILQLERNPQLSPVQN